MAYFLQQVANAVPVAALYRDDGILYLTKKRDELLTRIRLPAPDGWRAVYRKGAWHTSIRCATHLSRF